MADTSKASSSHEYDNAQASPNAELHDYTREALDTVINALSGGVAVYRLNPQGITTEYFSDGLPPICGRTREEFTELIKEKAISSFVYEDDIPEVMEIINSSIETRQPQSLIFRVKCADGSLSWTQMRSSFVGIDGEDTIYYAVFTPPTAEAKLFREMVEATRTAVLVAERKTSKVLFANKAWKKLQHVPEGIEIIGCSPANLADKRDRVVSDREIEGFSAEEFTDIHFLRHDGVHLDIQGKLMNWNGIDAYILYAHDVTAEYEARKKDREAKTMLTAALAMSNVFVSRLDLTTKTMYMDSRVPEMLGLPAELSDIPESLIGSGCIHPDDVEALRDLYKRVYKGQSGHVEIRQRYPSQDDYRWGLISYTPLIGENGTVTEAVGASSDIHEQKMREQSYQMRLNERATAGERSVLSAILNLNRNEVIELKCADDSLRKTTESGTADGLLSNIAAHISLEHESELFESTCNRKALIEAAQQGNSHGTLLHNLIEDKEWVELRYDVIANPTSGEYEAFFYVDNVTDSVRMENVMRTLAHFDYENVFIIDADSGSPSVSGSDKTTSHVDMMFNTSSTVGPLMQVESFMRNICLDDDLDRVIEENSFSRVKDVLSRSDHYHTHFRVNQDGEVHHKRSNYSYLENDSNFILCAIQDVTEQFQAEVEQQKTLQQALKDAQAASEAKTKFLSSMSHEIRTPMNAITGITRLAREVESNPPQTLEYLEELDNAGNHLLSVINDVLDMGRIESGRLDIHPDWTPMSNISRACIEMVSPMMREHGIEFRYATDESIMDTSCYVDAVRLRQVFMNILSNAAKFTPAGGKVTMREEFEIIDPENAKNIVVISDTGCGMSRQFLERIFKPFEREENPNTGLVEGTGLGLAISRRIVDAMGGSIEAKSELGCGTTFTITIPCRYRRESSEGKVVSKPKVIDLSGLRILLVDDNAVNRIIAQKLLESKGATVEEAVNGLEATEMFAAAKTGYYDAVLMDVRMPIMDGLDATRTIRRSMHPDAHTTPIIALTADAFDEERKATLEAGMNAHLAKPVDPVDLFTTIMKLTDR